MAIIDPIIAVVFIILVAFLLTKKFNPQAVLLISGLAMLTVSYLLGNNLPELENNTGFWGFDLFRYIKESFATNNMGVGLLIMAIGGFVAYIKAIGASNSLVYIALKPLQLFRKRPYLAATLVIPLGQILFVAIPSAAGLGLLLMASVYPILINLGVSKLTSVSVITATTAFGMGPASAITANATAIVDIDIITYFVKDQIPLVIPISLVMMIAFYFVNRYFDKKENPEIKALEDPEELELTAPLYYAIIPILPLLLLIVFSKLFTLFKTPIILDTSTAMFISLFVGLIFELVRKRNLREVFDSLKIFWEGMGNMFKSVVTLIIAADIFSKGLINLGFIDGLIQLSQHLGLGAIGIAIVMTVLIFMAAMLMGSGDASFFSFGPLVPGIAAKLGMREDFMILPMQLSASMGRTISPVSGVLIATAGMADISPFAVAKRNLIPLGISLITMIIYHFI